MATTPRVVRKPDGSITIEDDESLPQRGPKFTVDPNATTEPYNPYQTPPINAMGRRPAPAPVAAPTAPATPKPAGASVPPSPFTVGAMVAALGVKEPDKVPGVRALSPAEPPPVYVPSATDPVRAKQEEAALRKEKWLLIQNKPLGVGNYNIGRLNEINNRLAQLTNIQRTVQPATTPEQAAADTMRFRTSAAGTFKDLAAPVFAKQAAGKPVTPEELERAEYDTKKYGEYANPDPAEVFRVAQARAAASQRDAARNAALRDTAVADEERRVAQERDAATQAREAEIRRRALEKAQSDAQIAATQAAGDIEAAKGAAAGADLSPEVVEAERERKRLESQGNVARLRASTALDLAKAKAYESGTAPELVDEKLKARAAALANVDVDPQSIRDMFQNFMPLIAAGVEPDRSTLASLLRTPGGTQGIFADIAGLFDTPAPRQKAVLTLLDRVAKLEEAEQSAPGSARSLASNLLTWLPPTAGTEATYRPLQRGFTQGEAVTAARLNELRSRLQRLASGSQ